MRRTSYKTTVTQTNPSLSSPGGRYAVLTRPLISHCRTSAQVTQPRAQTAMTTHIVCSKKCNHGYNEVTYVYVQNHQSLTGRYGHNAIKVHTAHSAITALLSVESQMRTQCAPRAPRRLSRFQARNCVVSVICRALKSSFILSFQSRYPFGIVGRCL